MDASTEPPVRRRDVIIAAVLCMTLLGGVLALDSLARSSIGAAPLFHDLTCEKGLVVDITNQNGGSNLTRPDAGLNVRVHRGEEPTATVLVLYMKEGDRPWRFRWQLDAPSGKDIFYLPVVDASTQAYVRAEPKDARLCAADSRVLTA